MEGYKEHHWIVERVGETVKNNSFYLSFLYPFFTIIIMVRGIKGMTEV